MTEFHRTDRQNFLALAASSIRRTMLIAVLAIFFAPVSGLMEAGTASAQSHNPQHRTAKRAVPRKRVRVRHRYSIVKKPKPSFLGGLFGNKPQTRARPRTIKPLFGNFKIKIPGLSSQNPAALQANYERKMRAAARRGHGPVGARRYAPIRGGARGRSSGENASPRRAARARGRGKYRTMCVRLCDGYYFPVSFKTGSGRFGGDEKRCNSECYNAPTKLFYYSNPGGSIENMRALDGGRYKDLANAFKYRKEFVADCRCKAEPWTAQAKQQHQSWAQEKENRLQSASSTALDGEPKGQNGEAKIARNTVSNWQY